MVYFNHSDFLKSCVDIVMKEYEDIKEENVYLVWSCKTLQNSKAILATSKDDSLFEITYNGDRKEIYVDKYNKEKNYVVKI